MRYSAFLLASSLTLHVSDVEATTAAAETVTNPNEAHTFRDSYDKTEDDERMLPSTSGGTQKISDLFSGTAQKIMDIGKFLRQAPQKTPEVIFEEIRAGTSGTSKVEMASSALLTMNPQEMTRVLNVFEKNKMFLVDKFIEEWGIDAVATSLVEAKRSNSQQNIMNGGLMSKELMKSFDLNGNYDQVFEQLQLTTGAKEHAGFIDGRVELLDDYLKSKPTWITTDGALFLTLKEGFGGYANLAHLIDLAKAEKENLKYIENLETRFLIYFKERGETPSRFFNELNLPDHGYKMFQQPEFRLVEKFLVLKGDHQSMLKVLIEGFGGEDQLAIELSKGVGESDLSSKEYEQLLFQHLKSEKQIAPNKIKNIFREKELASEPAKKFIERYQKWYTNHAK